MPAEPLGRDDFADFLDAVKLAVAEAAGNVPQLLDATQARTFLGLSKTGWHRAKSAGKLPAAVYVEGSGDRWRRKDLVDWLDRLRPGRRRRGD